MIRQNCRRKLFRFFHSDGREFGGAALEYILVSTFAAVVGMAALTFLGRVIEQQLARLSERLDMGETPDLDSPFEP